MSRESIKDKLARDEVVVVVNPDHPSASLTEYLGRLGVDGAFIDCEHGGLSAGIVADMCRATRASGIDAIVRCETHAHYLYHRYFDAGADGLIVPHVDTREAAEDIVASVRAIRYADHAKKLVVAMVESVVALRNLDDLLSVQGIDVFFIGPDDLSLSMGHAGHADDRDVQQTIAETIGRIRAAGKIPGTLVTAETSRHFAQLGCRFLYEHLNTLARAGWRNFREALQSPTVTSERQREPGEIIK